MHPKCFAILYIGLASVVSLYYYCSVRLDDDAAAVWKIKSASRSSNNDVRYNNTAGGHFLGLHVHGSTHGLSKTSEESGRSTHNEGSDKIPETRDNESTEVHVHGRLEDAAVIRGDVNSTQRSHGANNNQLNTVHGDPSSRGDNRGVRDSKQGTSSHLDLQTLDNKIDLPRNETILASEEVSATRIQRFDPNGYIFFCLCMGNLGNQIDQLLGSLAFAKKLNRTMVISHISVPRIPFTDWFQPNVLSEYHRVLLAGDFMKYIAPEHWPPAKRVGFCWLNLSCVVKNASNRQFWDGFGVDFNGKVVFTLDYSDSGDLWKRQYPASRYPVLAFQGAPAAYPVLAEYRGLQRLLVFSEGIQQEARDYIDRQLGDEKFVGIHLRNGQDWVHACRPLSEAFAYKNYMSSPQCLQGTAKSVTSQMCSPSKQEIIRLVRKIVSATGATAVFVGTDRNPMVEELKSELQVNVVTRMPRSPIIDLAILTMSDHFIGNCVSSFTAFVKRARDVAGKPTSFWGLS